MFRHNRNETNRNKNNRPTERGHQCSPTCESNTYAGQNPFIPERDTSLIDPIEEERSDPLNFSRSFEEEQYFPHFIQISPMHNRGPPEFRATQITRIQTTIMDEEVEEEEECECSNTTTWPSPNIIERPTKAPQTLKFPIDSILLKRNLAYDRASILPQFADNENQCICTSAPFTPRREVISNEYGDPGANVSYMKQFGNLVANQRNNLETRFIVYKVKLRESKSLRAILMKKKYVLMSIPLVLCLLWLILLLGVLIGSVFCSEMEECPWAKGTTMAPRFMYTSHSVF